MRRSRFLLLTTLTAALAIPALAASDQQHGRDQSYFTYDDGGTVLKQGDDGRDVDVRVNLPIYPGDDITSSRHGRTEIRLSDGNVLAMDHDTQIHVRSILDSYDGDNAQTVIELRYGHVAIQRTAAGHDYVRLDTASASYVAQDEAIYAVEADSHGKDRVTVFTGSIEARTPGRTIRVRANEEARVDDQGLYGLVSLARNAGDDFEHWFLQRAVRYDAPGHYLDSSLAYSEADLDDNGSWVYSSGVSAWCWRPHVDASWRPYYNGYWSRSRSGCLVWVSYEPWGWAPYHYGRWAYEPAFGWVWLPGSSYSPAWVYWMYGPSYVGWAPMGWYDCYRPYYGWAYRPYARARLDIGFGFYGRVHVGEIDLRPWTFISPDHIISTRVDHAALTADVIRERLHREPGAGFVTIGSGPARFTHDDLKDPAMAVGNIARRGIGSGTGNEGSGSAVDMTPFFRRDPEISNTVRDHIVHSRPVISTPPPSSAGGVSTGRGAPSGVPTPGTGGTLEGRINRGDGSAPRGDNPLGNVPIGTLHRGDNQPGSGSAPAPAIVPRGQTGSNDHSGNAGNWRDQGPKPPAATTPATPAVAPPPSSTAPPSDTWRGRAVGRGGDRGGTISFQPPNNGQTPATTPPDRGSDIPREIIDRIGGARIHGDDGSATRGSGSTGTSTQSGSASSGTSGSSAPSGNSGSSHNSGSGSSGSSGSSGKSGSSSSSGSSGSSSSGSHSSSPPSSSSSSSSSHSSSSSSSSSSGSKGKKD